MIVRELITKLGFKTDEKALKRYSASIDDIKQTLTKVSIASAVAFAGFAKLVESVENSAIKFLGLSKAIKTSVADLQALEYIETTKGVHGLIETFRSLSEQLSSQGPGAARFEFALNRVGIATRDLSNKLISADSLLESISSVMQQMSAPRAQRLAKTLGISPSIVDLLREGRQELVRLKQEFKDLNGGIKQTDAILLDSMHKALLRIRSIIAGINRSITLKLAPAMSNLLRDTQDWLLSNRESIVVGVTRAVENLSGAFNLLLYVLKPVGTALEFMIRQLGGIENAVNIASIALVAFVGGPMLGISKAIAGVSAGIALVVEDFYRWSKGGSSLFSGFYNWLSKIKEMLSSVRGVLSSVTSGILGAGSRLLSPFSKMGSGISQAYNSIMNTNVAAATIPANNAQYNNSNVNMQADVTVNVPAGTSAEQAVAIEEQVRNSLAQEISKTRQNIVVNE